MDRSQLNAILQLTSRLPAKLFEHCVTLKCILRELMGDNDTMPMCKYRYSDPGPHMLFALWVDGPCTALAAILALTGCYFAIRFLVKAGLNRDLTAALFSLCIVDCLLMCTVFCFYSIEAIAILFFGTNIMYNRQSFTSSLHGVASSMTTSSTLLVIYISFQRFMVVMRPLRYANSMAERSSRSTQRRSKGRRSNSDSNAFLSPTADAIELLRTIDFRRFLKPYLIPCLVIILSFAINIPVFFEFAVEPCWDEEHKTEATYPVPTVFRFTFARYKTILNSITQTFGPVATITLLTLLTEIRVHRSLKERRRLFESQKRNRNVVVSEELKETVSRTVSIFIAVKFIILRSMLTFFDIYENLYGIESFGVVLSILVRITDFMVVLNSATNSLAYFGKKRWLEKRLRLRILKKEEKKQQKMSMSVSGPNDSRRTSIALPRQVLSCTTSICPTTSNDQPLYRMKETSQSCKDEDSVDEVNGERRQLLKHSESPLHIDSFKRPIVPQIRSQMMDGTVMNKMSPMGTRTIIDSRRLSAHSAQSVRSSDSSLSQC